MNILAKVYATQILSNTHNIPDSKVHGAYMGLTWGRQDPGRPHVGPMKLAIRNAIELHKRIWLC